LDAKAAWSDDPTGAVETARMGDEGKAAGCVPPAALLSLKQPFCASHHFAEHRFAVRCACVWHARPMDQRPPYGQKTQTFASTPQRSRLFLRVTIWELEDISGSSQTLHCAVKSSQKIRAATSLFFRIGWWSLTHVPFGATDPLSKIGSPSWSRRFRL